MRHRAGQLAIVFVVLGAAVMTATLSSSLLDRRGAGATSTVSEAPSAPASASSSILPSTSPESTDASSAAAAVLIGQLVALPEVGCPGLHAEGKFYLLLLPTEYAWTEDHEAVTHAGSVVARRGDAVAVIGTEAGLGVCWATSFSHSLEVVSLSRLQPQPTPTPR